MNSALPKFRRDLTVRQQQTEGGTVFTVKDPVSGEFFRFREAEHFIAEQLDGETSLETVRKRTEERFDAALSVDTLSAFARTLKKAGLLESEEGEKSSASKKRGRLRGNLLSLRFKAFDPARLFDRMIHRVRFFFTPSFVVISAVILFLAIWTTAENWTEYVNDLPRLYRLDAVPLFILVNFLVVTGHEFGHGLTCRHFGGEVREMGFMFIYFQPALFCNVSDAWLFPERWKRMWVGFAGPYFELFLWALATLAWRVTDVDSWINYIGLIVMTTSGINSLVNFNPLIKLDGYYLLSDYLNIPNLRKKSFLYVGEVMKRLTGRIAHSVEGLSPRERRIYLVYGVLATIFSFSILGFATMQMGGFLIENNQPVPLAAFVGMVGLRFRDRLGRLFGNRDRRVDTAKAYSRSQLPKPSNGSGSHAANHGSAETKPSNGSTHHSSVSGTQSVKPDNGSPKDTSPQKRDPKRTRRIKQIVLGYLVAFALVILFFGYTELKVGGAFMILPVHDADIRSAIDGIVEEVAVIEGQQVKAGDLIARLSDRESRAELQRIQAQLQQLHWRLSMLEVGPTREEIDVAQSAVAKASDRLKYAHKRLLRNKSMMQKNLIAGVEYENSQESAVIAEGDLAEARTKLKLLLKGARKEEVEGARAEITSLEAQQRHLEDVLRRVEVRSPVAGTVATPARQLEEMEHQAVQKGTLIAKVYDFKKLMVEIAVSEKDIADVKVGQKVGFKSRAYPDDTFYGTVTATATTAQAGSTGSSSSSPLSALSSSTSSGTTVLVTTVIDNSTLRLKPGMTGQAKIFCGERKNITLLARRLAKIIKVEFWSWW